MNHFHVALSVQDLDRSLAFYQALFDVTADKTSPKYARLTVQDPALVLGLNAARKVKGGNRVQHFGVRFGSTEAYEAARARIEAAGLIRKEQRGTKCCYAVQDKAWVRDPDGNDWEFYDLLADLPLPDHR